LISSARVLPEESADTARVPITDILDPQQVWEIVEQDRDFLEGLIQIFRDDASRLVSAMANAIVAKDQEALLRAPRPRYLRRRGLNTEKVPTNATFFSSLRYERVATKSNEIVTASLIVTAPLRNAKGVMLKSVWRTSKTPMARSVSPCNDTRAGIVTTRWTP
jgi:hypothetical protein